MPLQQYDDQYRRPLIRKKNTKAKADKELFQKYGITREELDIILSELCEKYQQNWVTVSAALFQEHGIVLNSACIKERYGLFLDPNLRRDGFTRKEQMSIIKMFCLDGASCKDFMKIFPNRERLMFKNILHIEFRKAYSKLQEYLHDEIRQLPPQNIIRNGEDNVQNIVRALASETNYEWRNNIAGYKILYFFVVTDDAEKLSQMPKEVAMLFYKRMYELTLQMRQQRLKHYNRIDPQYRKYREKQVKSKKRTKGRRGWMSDTSSQARIDSTDSSLEVKRQQNQIFEESVSIANLPTKELALRRSQVSQFQAGTQLSDLFQGMEEDIDGSLYEGEFDGDLEDVNLDLEFE